MENKKHFSLFHKSSLLNIQNKVVKMYRTQPLKHNGLCEGLADSNYFYTEESVPCTNFCVGIMPLVCTLRTEI